MNKFKLAMAVALSVSLVAGAASAQEKKGRLAACKDDIKQLCASEPKGKGKIRGCLETNKDKVSADCKTALEALPKKS